MPVTKISDGLYSAEEFAVKYNRRRSAEHFLRVCFFPRAKYAASQGNLAVEVLSHEAGDASYLELLAAILGKLGWVTYRSDGRFMRLFAILPV